MPSYKKWMNYTISILLCAWLCSIIFYKLKTQTDLRHALDNVIYGWSNYRVLLLFIILVCMFVNWSIEALKWQILLKTIQPISFWRSLRSVFTGIAISLLTPNRIGEYAGRIAYLKNNKKFDGISANIVSSYGQFIAAATFGILGCSFYIAAYSYPNYLPVVLIGSILGLLLLLYFYFRLHKVVSFFSKTKWLQKIHAHLLVVNNYNSALLVKIILLSALRYFVFALQFYILLLSLGVSLSFFPAILCIFVVYWLMAIMPTIAIAEIPVRTVMSSTILGVLSSNTVAIMSASILLWLINLILPAVLGAIGLIGAKINDRDMA
jgi:uncharacterized membrane protein YbhN (UPF0104 family)